MTTSITDTLRGQRMLDKARATGHISALTDGEVASGLALGWRALGLLLPVGQGGMTSAAIADTLSRVGGPTLWGMFAVAIFVPQIIGWGVAWFGGQQHHELRIFLLCLTAGYHAAFAALWISAGSINGFGVALMFCFLAARSVSRVWAYNGVRFKVHG